MTTTIAAQAYTRKPELNNTEWYLGYRATYLAETNDTGGQFALMEMWGHQGCEPPTHIHTKEDEFFYLLEGQATFYAGPYTFEAGPGSFAYLPAGVPHTFKIHTPTARAIVGMTPSGFENFFRGMAVPAEHMELPPIPTAVDVPRLINLACEHEAEFLPPGMMPADAPAEEGSRKPIFWQSSTGEPLNVLGARMHVLADASASNGLLSVFLSEEEPNPGPPLHIHRNEDEAFYVLEGEVTFQIEDEVLTLGPGQLAYAPRGSRHTYRVTGTSPAKMLVLTTPSGCEQFFSAISALSAPSIYEVIATAGQHGIEIVGYPIGL